MYFRPFPILTLFAVPILATLVGLGVWQAQRAGWKTNLINEFEALATAPPLSRDALCSGGLAEGAVIEPPQARGPALRVFGHNGAGAPGWREFAVADLCGRQVLVQSGFEALEIGGPGGMPPPGAEAEPVIDRYVVEGWPEKSFMAAANAPDRNEWHWFDPAAMAMALSAADLDARFILTPYTGPPDFLSRTPPESHIGYSVTWFGMAVAFVVIYGVLHARAGRLRFGRTGG